MSHTLNDVVWNESAWPALQSLHQNLTCDVCVIGLGASGLHAIEYLVTHGVDVVGIDAGMVGGGAAGSNGGFILAGIAAFHHDAVSALGHDIATRLYHETLEEIALLAQHEPLFRQSGSIRIAADADEYADCVAQYECMRRDGLAVEWYDGNEGKGILFPHDGVFQPLLRVRRMARAMHDSGVRIFERTPAHVVAPGVVHANGSIIRCRTVIVAVDGRLEQLLPTLQNQVRTTRLQMLATAPDPQVTLARPVYYRYGYDYWQQLPNGSIAMGGCRDLHEAAEWGFAVMPTQPVQQSIEATLRTVVGSQAPITHRWGAAVAYRTDDVRPLVAQISPGVWVCGAYNGTGNIVGAICAKHVARAIVTGTTTHLRWWVA